MNLCFIPIVPHKQREDLGVLVKRANRFIRRSRLQVVSIETATIDIHASENQNHFFDFKNSPATQILRIWYDANNVENRTRHTQNEVTKVLSMSYDLEDPQDDEIDPDTALVLSYIEFAPRQHDKKWESFTSLRQRACELMNLTGLEIINIDTATVDRRNHFSTNITFGVDYSNADFKNPNAKKVFETQPRVAIQLVRIWYNANGIRNRKLYHVLSTAVDNMKSPQFNNGHKRQWAEKATQLGIKATQENDLHFVQICSDHLFRRRKSTLQHFSLDPLVEKASKFVNKTGLKVASIDSATILGSNPEQTVLDFSQCLGTMQLRLWYDVSDEANCTPDVIRALHEMDGNTAQSMMNVAIAQSNPRARSSFCNIQ